MRGGAGGRVLSDPASLVGHFSCGIGSVLYAAFPDKCRKSIHK